MYIIKIVNNKRNEAYIGTMVKSLTCALQAYEKKYAEYNKRGGKVEYVYRVLQDNDYDIVELENVKDFRKNEDAMTKVKFWMKKLHNVHRIVNNYA